MKKGRTALLLLSAALLVTGCSKVSANLKNPDDPIVVDQNGNAVNVENNEINQIFNSIKNGDSYSSSVKDMLTEAIAKAYVGDYRVDSNGLVYIVGLDLNDNTSVMNFVNEHKFYWNWVSTSTSVEFEEEPSSSNVEDYKVRIQAYIDLVQKEIVTTLYDEAVVVTYMNNNRFYESLYAKSVYEKLYTVYNESGNSVDPTLLYREPTYKDPENASENKEFVDAGFTTGKLVTREYNPEDNYKMVIEGDTQLLHLYHYVDYINLSIIPDILSNLLTESYIFERQYQSIGRTQARKVNFIKVTDTSSKMAQPLMRSYINTILRNETERNVNFSTLIDAWEGSHDKLALSENEEARNLALSVYGEESTRINSGFASYIDGKTGEDYPYFNGSLYGDIIKNYSELTNNPSTNDSTIYTTFTSIDGIPYTPEEGLAIQIENLETSSYVTNEWGTSSSFDLGGSDMITNLFSYGLATEFERATDPNTSYVVDGYYLKQFTQGGPVFLKNNTYTSDVDSILWQNENDYYIVEIVDQVSLDTLALNSDSTEEEKDSIEEYARNIGYTVASEGTYTNNALLYYLEQSNINYYDEDVRDYFESEFPDLFE